MLKAPRTFTAAGDRKFECVFLLRRVYRKTEFPGLILRFSPARARVPQGKWPAIDELPRCLRFCRPCSSKAGSARSAFDDHHIGLQNLDVPLGLRPDQPWLSVRASFVAVTCYRGSCCQFLP